MYPDDFDYYRAESVEQVFELLEEHADKQTELLAGGHSLLPTMKTGFASPDVLIDIGDITELQGIDRDGDELEIGALTRYATLAESPLVESDAPVIGLAAAEIGDVQVRERGTIGGNIAHADPASDLPGAILAADATVVVRGPDGERTIDADEFFVGMYATTRAEDELLTAIRVPRASDTAVAAYLKKPSPSSGYVMVGVATVVEIGDGVVESARVAANGVMDSAVRLPEVEEAIVGTPVEGDDDKIAAAAARATEGLDTMMMMDDLQASSEFRAHLLEAYTERALRQAVSNAAQ